MKKLIIIILLILLSVSVCFAEDNTNRKLNNKSIQEDSLFVPFFDFLDSADIEYKVSPNSELSTYKDNMFIKFYPYSNTYSINGKQFNWENKPFYDQNNVLYIDGNIFKKYFLINYTYDNTLNKIFVKNSNPTKKVFDDFETYKKVLINNPDFYIYIPDFWEKIDENMYGKSAKNDKFTLEIIKESIPDSDIKHFKKLIKKKYIEKYEAEDDKKIKKKKKYLNLVKGIKIYNYRYYFIKDDIPQYDIFSFFKVDKELYVFKFNSNIADLKYILDVVEKIESSISTGKYQVNTNSEHYIEYEEFDKNNIVLNSKLYSNMCVNNYVTFEGTTNKDIDTINVYVEKNGKVFKDVIDIENGKFNKTISIPFGLGLHNVSLYVDKKAILKTSIINTSIEEELYVSSSKRINVYNKNLDFLLKNTKITYTDYMNAKIIFKNLTNNMELVDGKNNFDQSLIDKKANEYDLNRIYLASLRKIRIPSRMIKDASTNKYYVQFKSNGRWLLTDPSTALANKKKNVPVQFNIRKKINKKNITYLYY